MTVSFPRARWIALASIVAIAFLSGGWLLRPRPAAGGGVYQQARLFENVVGAINRHYIDSMGEGDLYQRAAEALVTSLKDPYAELLIHESYREYQRQMTGTEVEFDLQRATESGFESEHGPALGRDDEVLSIDGSSTEGWPTERIEEALRTAAGPTVTVVVRTRGSESPVVRRITRTTVHIPATSAGVLLKGGVGYVVLRRMSESAAAELREAVDRLEGQGMRALVLDLRSNPGGLIREGVKVAGLFLQPGDTVAISRGRSSSGRAKTYLASDPGGWDDLRLVVLVNRGTASSAELVAGALQDHDRAVLVGTPTYGKGMLQTTYPLGDQVAIKLTTARWYTPTGRWVQRPLAQATGAPGNRTPALEPRVLRTPMGRPMPDQSGILPDLMVRTSLRSDGERVLHLALGDDLDRFRAVLASFAADLRADPAVRDESFSVTQEMRDSLFDRLEREGIALNRESFDEAAPYVSEQLGYELTRERFGTESVVRRQAKADRQLQAALRLLRETDTQQEAITAAVAAQASGRVR